MIGSVRGFKVKNTETCRSSNSGKPKLKKMTKSLRKSMKIWRDECSGSGIRGCRTGRIWKILRKKRRKLGKMLRRGRNLRWIRLLSIVRRLNFSSTTPKKT